MKRISRIWKLVRHFCREEDGPTSVEYAVMLAFILAACMATVNTLAISLRDNFNESAEALTKAGP